jgi:hypothetical protein
MPPAIIWIIDSEQWPRALLRAELIERGFDAVGYLTTADALATIGQRPPHSVIIELGGLSRHDVAPLFDIGVPVIGIAGAAEANQRWIVEFPWFALLYRPVSIGEIVSKLDGLAVSH